MAMDTSGPPRRAAVAPTTIVDFLAGTTLFRACDRPTIEKIAPHVFAAKVAAGTMIVRSGAPDPGLGFLFNGRAVVRAIDAPTGKSLVIEEVGVGDAFGETGAFLGTIQPHEVVAETDCTVLLLGHDLIDRTNPPALPRPVGCAECNGTGYVGRIAVVEMLQLNDAMRAQVMAGLSLAELEQAATEQGHLVSFRRSAVHLMGRQLISPSEALLTLT